jgi:NADH-quinone oxidoreductase subunit K
MGKDGRPSEFLSFAGSPALLVSAAERGAVFARRLGFLIKRNLITVFMSIELMLNGVNLSFVTFAHQWHAVKGQIFVFFVMMVAAAEAAVGLAIIIAVFRARATLAVDRIDLMKL